MKQPTIVIVEDERIVAEDIIKTLERRGYRIAAIASSGEMAIEKISVGTKGEICAVPFFASPGTPLAGREMRKPA